VDIKNSDKVLFTRSGLLVKQNPPTESNKGIPRTIFVNNDLKKMVVNLDIDSFDDTSALSSNETLLLTNSKYIRGSRNVFYDIPADNKSLILIDTQTGEHYTPKVSNPNNITIWMGDNNFILFDKDTKQQHLLLPNTPPTLSDLYSCFLKLVIQTVGSLALIVLLVIQNQPGF
jgi:hypothetical protein